MTSLAVAVLDEFQASIGLFIFVADLFTGRPDDEDVVGAVGDVAASCHVQLAGRFVLGLAFAGMRDQVDVRIGLVTEGDDLAHCRLLGGHRPGPSSGTSVVIRLSMTKCLMP